MMGVLDKLKQEIQKEALERVTPLLEEIKITNKTLKEIKKELNEIKNFLKKRCQNGE